MSSFQKQSMSKKNKLWDKKANNEEFKEPIKKSKLAESGKSKSPAAVSSKIMSMKVSLQRIKKNLIDSVLYCFIVHAKLNFKR